MPSVFFHFRGLQEPAIDLKKFDNPRCKVQLEDIRQLSRRIREAQERMNRLEAINDEAGLFSAGVFALRLIRDVCYEGLGVISALTPIKALDIAGAGRAAMEVNEGFWSFRNGHTSGEELVANSAHSALSVVRIGHPAGAMYKTNGQAMTGAAKIAAAKHGSGESEAKKVARRQAFETGADAVGNVFDAMERSGNRTGAVGKRVVSGLKTLESAARTFEDTFTWGMKMYDSYSQGQRLVRIMKVEIERMNKELLDALRALESCDL